MKLRSNAKINLSLVITGRRDDGYHTLFSLFAPLSLHDIITIEESAKTEIISEIKDNIVLKLVNFLKDEFKIDRNVAINIQKKIPVGAGLGGGSSNAAFVLNALDQLWKLNLTESEKLEIALKFGADVPFFLVNKPSIVSGIGEEIEPLQKLGLELPILLVNPNIHVSTKEVFELGNFEFDEEDGDDETGLFFGRNDLIDNAIEVAPEIGDLLDSLEDQKGVDLVSMSGSGATCYAIFENKEDLTNALNYYKNVGYWTHSEILKI